MRISIEWSRLYPKKGQLDQSAVDTYNRMFDCMERCVHLPGVESCKELLTAADVAFTPTISLQRPLDLSANCLSLQTGSQ